MHVRIEASRIREFGGQNRSNRITGRGVPYAPLAWDPLFVPQPVELAATPLPFPDLPSFATEPIYLEDFRELPRMFDELRTAFGALRETVRSETRDLSQYICTLHYSVDHLVVVAAGAQGIDLVGLLRDDTAPGRAERGGPVQGGNCHSPCPRFSQGNGH